MLVNKWVLDSSIHYLMKLALKDTDGAVQKFANDFTAEALTKNLSATANSGKITEENKTSYTFNNLAAGYYLVYVSLRIRHLQNRISQIIFRK